MVYDEKKIVVFDLDETLGYFVELGIFCDAIENYLQRDITNSEFNKIMDLFPEFMRPNIIEILNYLKLKKNTGICDKIMIYTNNQGPKSWSQKIKLYYETKVKYNLFDQIIAAFKVHGKRVELCRTSKDKTYADLLSCTRLPSNTKICFLDDQYHPEMEHDNVIYINIKPYIHSLSYKEMSERYYLKNKDSILDNIDQFNNKIIKYMNLYNYKVESKSEKEINIDKIISKQILFYLKEFFKSQKLKTKTRKRKGKINNKTYKVFD